MSIKKQMTRFEARAAAIMLSAVSIFSITFCIKWYFGYQNIISKLNPDQIIALRKALFVETFVMIPALSTLLILGSYIIWRQSERLDDSKGMK
jgi:hypothetical protein